MTENLVGARGSGLGARGSGNRSMNRRTFRTVALLAALLLGVSLPPRASSFAVQPQQAAPASARWADWVEPDFPFFSSVVDARAAGLGHADNLSPRALVLNLGHGCWAAFDTDLLRVAAIWNGQGLSANALAPGSYLRPDKKTPDIDTLETVRRLVDAFNTASERRITGERDT